MAERKKMLSVMVDPEILESLKLLADREGSEVTVSTIVRRALDRELGIYDHLEFSQEAMTAAVDQRLMELGLTREMKAVAVAQDELIEGMKANELYFDAEKGMLRPGPKPE